VEVDDADETTESGEEDREPGFEGRRFSRGKSTAIVPPKVGRLVSPHMLMLMLMLKDANVKMLKGKRKVLYTIGSVQAGE
jgi:hypothetical protein